MLGAIARGFVFVQGLSHASEMNLNVDRCDICPFLSTTSIIFALLNARQLIHDDIHLMVRLVLLLLLQRR